MGIPGTHTQESTLSEEPIVVETPVRESIDNTIPEEIFIPPTPEPTPPISTVSDWNPYEVLPLPRSERSRASILKADTTHDREHLNTTYSGSVGLGGYAVGKTLNISNGPFAITYTVHPTITDSLLVWAKLTVRDPWEQVIGEDGYNREYSSEETKTLTIYRQGLYYLTLEGEYVTVDYSVKTGDPAPEITATPVPAYSEDEFLG